MQSHWPQPSPGKSPDIQYFLERGTGLQLGLGEEFRVCSASSEVITCPLSCFFNGNVTMSRWSGTLTLPRSVASISFRAWLAKSRRALSPGALAGARALAIGCSVHTFV